MPVLIKGWTLVTCVSAHLVSLLGFFCDSVGVAAGAGATEGPPVFVKSRGDRQTWSSTEPQPTKGETGWLGGKRERGEQREEAAERPPERLLGNWEAAFKVQYFTHRWENLESCLLSLINLLKGVKVLTFMVCQLLRALTVTEAAGATFRFLVDCFFC